MPNPSKTGHDGQTGLRPLQLVPVVWLAVLAAGPVLASQPAGSAWHPAALAIYGLAQWVCHQRVERSFQFMGAPLPVCARCMGIYGGAAAIGLAAAASAVWHRGAFALRQADGYARGTLLAGAAPTAASVIWEWMTAVPVSNGVRALAGAVLGLAVAWVCVVPVCAADAALPVPRRSRSHGVN